MKIAVKKLCLVVISDIHLHEHPEFARQDPINTRLQEGVASLEWALDEANNISESGVADEVVVVLLGDLFHTKRSVSTVVLSEAARAFRVADKSLTIYAIPGNHDTYDANGRYTLLDAMSLCPNVCVFTEPRRMSFLDGAVRLVLMPYRRDMTGMYEVLYDLAAPEKSCGTLLACHGVLPGTVINDRPLDPTISLAPAVLARYKLVMAGDVHTPRYDPPYLCPGALLTHHFGDNGQSGTRGLWTVLVGTDGSLVVDHVPNPHSPAFNVLELADESSLDLLASGLKALATSVCPRQYLDLRSCRTELLEKAKLVVEAAPAGAEVFARYRAIPKAREVVRRSELDIALAAGTVMEMWVKSKSEGEQAARLLAVGRGIHAAAVGGS